MCVYWASRVVGRPEAVEIDLEIDRSQRSGWQSAGERLGALALRKGTTSSCVASEFGRLKHTKISNIN